MSLANFVTVPSTRASTGKALARARERLRADEKGESRERECSRDIVNHGDLAGVEAGLQ